jgi:hypothetical protein
MAAARAHHLQQVKESDPERRRRMRWTAAAHAGNLSRSMGAAGTGVGGRAAGVRLALALLFFCAIPGGPALRAQLDQPTLALELPADLRVGQHARVSLSVKLPKAAAAPLLVTPFHEGAALEIVKGRLLRSDALDPAANPLRFELPVLALAPGAAVLGARLLAYLCSGERCRAVEVETRANVIVLPR